MALRLQQRERDDVVGVAPAVLSEEIVGAAASEEHVDVRVAGRPRVAQHRSAATLEHLRAVVAQQVEGFAERRPPGLAPSGRTAGVAAAVVLPPPHAVGTRPGALVHVYLPPWLHLVDELRRVHDPHAGDACLVTEGIGQGAVGELVVVPEGLAVGGDAHGCAVPGRHDDAADQLLTRQPGEPEREIVRDAAVVEDEVDRSTAAIRMHPSIRLAAIDRTVRLAGCEDREPDPFVDERAQHVVVHRGLGQPHASRRTSEPVLEVGESPTDLGADVTLVGEREDHVVVRLRDGATADAVGLEHALVHLGTVRLQP